MRQIFLEKTGWSIGKQWRPWSDAAFCSVWSGSALFANYPFRVLRTTWVKLSNKYNLSVVQRCAKLKANAARQTSFLFLVYKICIICIHFLPTLWSNNLAFQTINAHKNDRCTKIENKYTEYIYTTHVYMLTYHTDKKNKECNWTELQKEINWTATYCILTRSIQGLPRISIVPHHQNHLNIHPEKICCIWNLHI